MIQAWMDRFQAAARDRYYTTPFHAQKYGAALTGISSYAEFSQLPFSYKHEIRESDRHNITAAKRGEVFGLFSSSGTTGDKTYYTFTNADKAVHTQCAETLLGGIGISAGRLGGVLVPIGTGLMGQTMMWQFTACGAGYINCPAPSPDAVAELVTRFPVDALAGLPNIAASVGTNPEWAAAARDSNVRTLLMGGDCLTEHKRRLLEQLWGADCYNMFGFSEIFGPFAGECRQKNGLHFLPQYLFIEVIDPATLQPVPEGEAGMAVYTTLWNKGFPLLRYWSDDFIRLSSEPCGCGNSLPRFWFMGRMADSFRAGTGRWVFPTDIEPILAQADFYGPYRVRRTERQYALELECEENTETVWLKIRSKLNALIGTDVQLRFVPRGTIFKGGGKYRRFVEGTSECGK